jgi:hypothetical protein
LRKILGLYGLVCYPDSDLIDQYGVDAYGNGADAYIEDAKRKRPVFITSRKSKRYRKGRDYINEMTTWLAPFGPVICSDQLFEKYGDKQRSGKLDILGVSPNADLTKALPQNEVRKMPVGLDYFLESCPIEQTSWGDVSELAPENETIAKIEVGPLK